MKLDYILNNKIEDLVELRGGIVLLILDFLLPFLFLIPYLPALGFEFVFGFIFGFSAFFIDFFWGFAYYSLIIFLITRFYFCEISKREAIIERFFLSLFNIVSIFNLYTWGVYIYSFATDENYFYNFDINPIIENLIFGFMVIIFIYTIITLFANFRKLSFELFLCLCIFLILILLLIQTITLDNWQIISIIYTLLILLFSKDNVNLFTKNKINIESEENKIEEFISSVKIIIGLIPLSLYAGISISENFNFICFGMFSHQINLMINRAVSISSVFTLCFFIINILFWYIRKKFKD